MEAKRSYLWQLGLLAALGLGWVLVQTLLPRSVSAQANPPPDGECCETIREFGGGGQTLAGPGYFSEPCQGQERTLLATFFPVEGRAFPILLNACVTLENLGDCPVTLILSRAYRGVITTSRVVPPHSTFTFCNEKLVTIAARCDQGGGLCRYLWRVDEVRNR